MNNANLVDRLSVHLGSFQEGFQILSNSRDLRELAKQFAHILRGSLLVKSVAIFRKGPESGEWEDLHCQTKPTPKISDDLKNGDDFQLSISSSPPFRLYARLPLTDGSLLAVLLDERLDRKLFSDFDKITAQLFLRLFDNAYQAFLQRMKEKELIFSLNNSIVQLNSLIDTGIEITSLENRESLFQLALGRGAALTNASKGVLRISKDEVVQDEIFFPHQFAVEEGSAETSQSVRSGFHFQALEYSFWLQEKESRQGLVPFDETDQLLLDAVAKQVSAALENEYLVSQSLEKQKIENDIAVAGSIQKRIIPEKLPQIDGYDLDGINIPSKDVGGDYYDCIRLADGRVALIIGDVSGKGVPAGLLVSSLQASLVAYLEADFGLSELVQKLNRVIIKASTPDKFITFFIAILSPGSGQLEIVNAGHNPIYLRRADGSLESLHTGGIALGMVAFAAPFKSERLVLNRGEELLFYTDGITEAMNEKEEFYEEETLEAFLLKNSKRPAKTFIHDLVADVKRFTGAAPQNDDITALFLKRLA